MTLSKRPGYPQWFWRLRRSARAQEKTIEVEGAAISYRTWGNPADRPILLLHGGGASADWWEAAALFLASEGYFLVAPNFTGCGGSSWRESYDLDQSTREAWACVVAEGVTSGPLKPICVAHSFGSEAGIRLALEESPAIAQLIFVDSLIGIHDSGGRKAFSARPRPLYPSRGDAIRRFSTLPRDDYGPAFLRYEVARKSLEKLPGADGGEQWSWTADPNVVGRMAMNSKFDKLGEVRCPLDFIYGECSSMNTPELRARQADLAPADSDFIPIADAGHHILLDKPKELARTILRVIGKRADQVAGA
jgi:pimeloyl-ACP methyl ester carboxylesterase